MHTYTLSILTMFRTISLFPSNLRTVDTLSLYPHRRSLVSFSLSLTRMVLDIEILVWDVEALSAYKNREVVPVPV